MVGLESIQPYVEQIFDDREVQRHLARANANLRGARSRAGRAKSKKQAVQDRQMWQRVLGGLGAALDAAVAIKHAPEKRSSSRGKWVLLLGGAGAAAYLATNEPARNKVLELAGQKKDASA